MAIPEPEGDPLQRLRELVARHLELTLAHRELGSIWAHETRALPADHARRVSRRSRKYLDRRVDVLARAFRERAEQDLPTAADAAIGTTSRSSRGHGGRCRRARRRSSGR